MTQNFRVLENRNRGMIFKVVNECSSRSKIVEQFLDKDAIQYCVRASSSYDFDCRTSSRQIFASTRLAGHEVTPDNLVNEEGEFVHFALLADADPINYEVALTEEMWKNAMIEELNSINRNNTWK